ncbi:shikimate dehydrogenase [Bacillus suaedaesalsae]|uniref:Shikimate dehydrogenase (NADP(+)) n=1 Tax=Bacillus suaedaesalsae TaxID=2810349 RepID=A0ABS2DL62_9BACI|nr:shikimate dehydrogenase [Bacillus suaedaesalsae]MBM6619223.1 shikimate dehydrogenase [Bacillus suaedaesalsae]
MEKLYGVIGDPISHSMSPLMHNTAFIHHGLNARYIAFHVTPERLSSAIEGLRGLNIGGMNVTIPHKVSVMKYLDEIDPLAKQIGAVNTIVNEKGKLVGYNTDGIGFVNSLKQLLQEKNLQNQSILVIGAGGAAKAIYYSLIAEGGKNVDVTNRTLLHAEDLIKEHSTSNAVTLLEAEQQLHTYDIIVNTTSVGMYPQTNDVPMQLSRLKTGAIVSDIIYNPFETQLLKEAKKYGAVTQNGINMFVFQGALAFEKWTGIYPDIETMKSVIKKKLGGVS